MKNLWRLASFFLFAGVAIDARASIPHDGNHATVVKILSNTSDEKFAELRNMGPTVYGVLRDLAFDEERTLPTRWQAFMAMVRLGERESLPEVNKALASGDWFLRDAALKVLPLLDKSQAYDAAFKKLDDSALIVRTSAVDILGKMHDPQCADKLWTQLYSKDNYLRHESLWIRRHIVQALADIAPYGSEEKFIKVLSDSDSTLFPPAIRGLERLTGKHFGSASESIIYQRHSWQAWYKEQQKSKVL